MTTYPSSSLKQHQKTLSKFLSSIRIRGGDCFSSIRIREENAVPFETGMQIACYRDISLLLHDPHYVAAFLSLCLASIVPLSSASVPYLLPSARGPSRESLYLLVSGIAHD